MSAERSGVDPKTPKPTEEPDARLPMNPTLPDAPETTHGVIEFYNQLIEVMHLPQDNRLFDCLVTGLEPPISLDAIDNEGDEADMAFGYIHNGKTYHGDREYVFARILDLANAHPLVTAEHERFIDAISDVFGGRDFAERVASYGPKRQLVLWWPRARSEQRDSFDEPRLRWNYKGNE